MNEQIRKRVQRLPKRGMAATLPQRFFSTDGECLICGRRFKNESCPHSVDDQEIAIKAFYAEELLK
jgi:hypothetical protein